MAYWISRVQLSLMSTHEGLLNGYWMMEEDVIPPLEEILQAQEDLLETELTFQDNRVGPTRFYGKSAYVSLQPKMGHVCLFQILKLVIFPHLVVLECWWVLQGWRAGGWLGWLELKLRWSCRWWWWSLEAPRRPKGAKTGLDCQEWSSDIYVCESMKRVIG